MRETPMRSDYRQSITERAPFPSSSPDKMPARSKTRKNLLKGTAILLVLVFSFQPGLLIAEKRLPCRNRITWPDALIVQDPEGKILYKINERKKCIPASTLKVLTALAAIEHFGLSYRFKTEIFLDCSHNLKVKGFGDPLLISEVLRNLASSISSKVSHFKNLVLDDTYFTSPIHIPGREHSSNPYDAPPGALSANFNTVAFQRDREGKIVSSETQTPMIPFAEERIRRLNLKEGRYTFIHDTHETTLYTGELLRHFLKEQGVTTHGDVRLGKIDARDRLIYVFQSPFTLEEAIEKMLFFSNNFMANQIMLALGASRFGPPADLEKGVRALAAFTSTVPGLSHVKLVEGSGISRGNRISALEMLTVLNRFKPYRHLLRKNHTELFKTGSLKGVRTRVGYLEDNATGPYAFVVYFNRTGSDMDGVMDCIKKTGMPSLPDHSLTVSQIVPYFLKRASNAFLASSCLDVPAGAEPLKTKYSQKFARSFSMTRSAMTSWHSL